MVGVARWPDPQYNNEDSPGQRSYGLAFRRASREIGSEISNGKISSFNQLWSRAREWRSNAAGDQSQKFNTQRDPHEVMPTYTPLADKYTYIKDRYSSAAGGIVEPHSVRGLPPMRRFQIEDEIDGQPVQLTSIMISADSAANRDVGVYSHLRSAGAHYQSEPHHIEHTPPSQIQRIMTHAESLYNRAVDPSISNNEALTTMGELHWWVANAMPDDRGSAAKVELSIRAIAQSRGMDLPPYSRGFVPDLEAMTTARAEFTTKYPASFDWRSASFNWRSNS